MTTFLELLIARVFKILPLKEQEAAGNAVFLDTYLERLADDLAVSVHIYPELHRHGRFCDVILGVEWLRQNEYSVPKCRSRVFGMLNAIKALQEELRDASC